VKYEDVKLLEFTLHGIPSITTLGVPASKFVPVKVIVVPP
jgi:hypothetical protein